MRSQTSKISHEEAQRNTNNKATKVIENGLLSLEYFVFLWVKMETKKSKYDTNPLDPDVERKAEDVWGDLGGVTPSKWRRRHVSEVSSEPPSLRTSRTRERTFTPKRRLVVTTILRSTLHTRQCCSPNLRAAAGAVSITTEYLPGSGTLSHVAASHRASASPRSGPRCWPMRPVLSDWLLPARVVPRAARGGKVRFHASQGCRSPHRYTDSTIRYSAVISTLTGSTLGGTLFKLAAFVF